jgi:hypothetical protein
MAVNESVGDEANFADNMTSFVVQFPDIPQKVFDEITPKEIVLAESLLTPGLQTSLKVHSYVHNLPTDIKWFDRFRGTNMKIKIERPVLAKYNYDPIMDIDQTTYRLGGRSSTTSNAMDDRKLINRTVEELVFHACDKTLLNDAAILVMKQWKCTTPSAVVQDVLVNCAGVDPGRLVIEPSEPARDYNADNIHPFQVVNQQANAALADGGNDPSFVHYMTYEALGTHRFESLFNMSRRPNILHAPLEFNSAGSSYADPHSLMHYSFPCDFDLLSDILNGVNDQGVDVNSVVSINPLFGQFSLFGNQSKGCGLGSAVMKRATTNASSAKEQNMCPDYTAAYLPKRQARMGLLEKDKIALRIVVAWNPIYHAGKVITVNFYNINDETKALVNYGSGDYLIVAMSHNIKQGGFSTTTMDCVSKTVGRGEV